MSLFDVLGDIIKPWNWGSLMVDTNANAKLAFEFWKPKVKEPFQWAAVLGGIDGECSYRPAVVGDHGEAFGIAQWHPARADNILRHTGIDVRSASFADQLTAMFWEMSDPKSDYRHVLPALLDSIDLWSAVTVLVVNFEKSSMQARDITRRVALAQGWAETFKGL